MTGDVVNLRQARKQKAHADKDQRAAESRAVHGRSKAERQRDASLRELERKRLDALKRDDG